MGTVKLLLAPRVHDFVGCGNLLALEHEIPRGGDVAFHISDRFVGVATPDRLQNSDVLGVNATCAVRQVFVAECGDVEALRADEVRDHLDGLR